MNSDIRIGDRELIPVSKLQGITVRLSDSLLKDFSVFISLDQLDETSRRSRFLGNMRFLLASENNKQGKQEKPR
jgi:hypothetical protein